MSELLISVVVPTCRRPELLSRCLDRLTPSVQSFDSNRYEVIVTDDGEPTTERLITESFPWAKWRRGPRRGPAANRNAGVAHARGRWIAFTDDDCVPSPRWLESFAAATSSGLLVYEGRTTCDDGCRSPLETSPVNLQGGYLWSCNMLVDRMFFLDFGGFDERFPYPHLEDVDFRDRLATIDYEFEFVPDAVVDHPGRPVASGMRLAKSHESDVYYSFKHERGPMRIPPLVLHIARHRINVMRRYRLSGQTLRAAFSLIVEVVVTAALVPFWNRKYRRSMTSSPLHRHPTRTTSTD